MVPAVRPDLGPGSDMIERVSLDPPHPVAETPFYERRCGWVPHGGQRRIIEAARVRNRLVSAGRRFTRRRHQRGPDARLAVEQEGGLHDDLLARFEPVDDLRQAVGTVTDRDLARREAAAAVGHEHDLPAAGVQDRVVGDDQCVAQIAEFKCGTCP